MFEDDGTGVRLAYGGYVFVSFWYGPPTVERLDFLFDHERRWVDRVEKFSAISIVDPKVGKEMTSEARKRAAEITEFFKEKMVSSSTVVTGTGFFPAMVRSVMAGIQLMSSRKIKWHVASEVDDALQFTANVHRSLALPFDLGSASRALDDAVGRKAA
jgi:hypothetical protein